MKQILILLLLFSVCSYSQDTWTWLNPSPQGKDLNSVVICSDGTLLAAGESSTLLRSTDNGLNWSFVSLPRRMNLQQITVSGNTVYIAADSGCVFVSTNSGSSFTATILPVSLQCVKVLNSGAALFAITVNGKVFKSEAGNFSWTELPQSLLPGISTAHYSAGLLLAAGAEKIFKSSDNGQSWNAVSLGFGNLITALADNGRGSFFAAGTGGKIFRSTDSGSSWSLTNGQGTSWIRSLSFFSADRGIAAGANNLLMITTDGGSNWIKQKAAGDILLKSVSCSSSGFALLAGERGILGFSTDFGSSWKLNYSDPNTQINDVFFTSLQVGWAVGNNGLLLHTTNGGRVWENVVSGTLSNLNAVRFLDSANGWGMGDRGAIVRTYDGGVNWELGTLSSTASINIADFSYLRLMARAVGMGGAVYDSYNFGKNWVKSISPSVDYDLYAYAAFDERMGLAVGQGGRMYWIYRYFSGTVYDNISLNTDENLMSACYFNKHGFVAGQYGIILKTTDGAHFRKIANLDVPYLYSITFVDTLNGFTGGSGGRLFKTTNSGDSWVQLPTGINNTIRKIFIREGRIWLLCSNSVLLTATIPNSQPASAREKEQKIIGEKLRVYPNPVKAGTVLTIENYGSSCVSASLLTVMGEEVTGKVFSTEGNTKNSFLISAGLASGVYLLKTVSSNGTEYKKLIIQ